MNCREFTEFLHEYLFGSLPAPERLEFEKHLAECPWCVASRHDPRTRRKTDSLSKDGGRMIELTWLQISGARECGRVRDP